MLMDFKTLAEAIKAIAYKAGEEIIKIYTQYTQIEIEYKSDQSPLTIADQTSNEIICQGLKNLDVHFPIISEENKQISYEDRIGYDYYWLVDPLDGTKEFIKRNGEFTVNIALIHQQKAILGVVYAPYLKEMYWGIKNEGAYQEVNREVNRLQAATFTQKDSNLKLVCSRSHLNSATQDFVDQFKQPELVPKGSSLKFLILAKGQAHIYPRLGPTMEWDTAAAQIILEEAGGEVIDENTKSPLRYNKESLLNPYFIAYGRADLKTKV